MVATSNQSVPEIANEQTGISTMATMEQVVTRDTVATAHTCLREGWGQATVLHDFLRRNPMKNEKVRCSSRIFV